MEEELKELTPEMLVLVEKCIDNTLDKKMDSVKFDYQKEIANMMTGGAAASRRILRPAEKRGGASSTASMEKSFNSQVSDEASSSRGGRPGGV